MIRLLSASLYRLKKSAAFWSCLIGMLVIASVFMVMQATSMEYTVPLSRVIFLPLSFYGVAAAAMVSVFTGRDFADGFIRNKLIFSKSRSQVVLSQLVTSCIACGLVYSVTVLYTFGTARFFFENNVEPDLFAGYFALGLSMQRSPVCSVSLHFCAGTRPGRSYGVWGSLLECCFSVCTPTRSWCSPGIKMGP